MRFFRIFSWLVVLNIGAWIISQEASAQQGRMSFEVFYNELSPYGQWVDYPSYGYVWIPSTGPDFAPYSSDGHWILTDYGWTWVSDYPWGWAPFHYGRWDYDDFYGWFWVPDNEWGPSWVNWRRADGYYGWAPMRPGISIGVSFGSGYTVPNNRWIFVRDRDFLRGDINHYYVNRTNNVTIIKNSSIINRTYTDQNRHSTYVSGPDRVDVQRITGRTIQPVVIRDNEKPGQNMRNGQLQIYRPQVQKNAENGRRPAPSRVVNLKDVRRPSERIDANPIPKVHPAINNRQKVQPAQPIGVTPTINNRQNVQPVQPIGATPTINSRQKAQQTRRPTGVTPAINNRQNVQPSRSINPPNRSQPQQPRNVNPSNNRGKEQKPQQVAPPIKNVESRPSQPNTNRDEKENGKR